MEETQAGVELLYRAVLLDEAGLIYDAEPLYLRSIEQIVHENRGRGSLGDKGKAIVVRSLGRLKELRGLMVPPTPPEPPRASSDPTSLTLEGERLLRAMEHKRTNLPPWSEEQVRKAMYLDTTEQPPFIVDKLVFSHKVKEDLLESVVLPCRFPQLFSGCRFPTRTLFFGPPGVGKTALLRQLSAFTDGAPVYEINLWDLTGRYVPDAEQLLGDIFSLAASDSRVLGKPAVIVLDEIDAMRPENQSRWAANLASLLDQYRTWGSDPSTNPGNHRLIVCAATNSPWRVESMLLRRFERRIFIPFPDDAVRKEIVRLHLEATTNQGPGPGSEEAEPFVASEDLLASIPFQTRGFTGSDLVVGCRTASIQRIRALQSATHFRRVVAEDGRADRMIACGPNEPGARRMTLDDFTAEEAKLLWVPPMTEEDVRLAFSTTRPSVEPDSEYMKSMATFQQNYT